MSHTNDLKGPTDEGACTSGISPWFVLPVELLHGFGFGVAWIATCGAPITWLLSDWHFPFPRSRWDWDSSGIPLCISFVVPTKALQRRVRRVISLSHNTPSYSSYTTHGHDLTFFSVILRWYCYFLPRTEPDSGLFSWKLDAPFAVSRAIQSETKEPGPVE